MAPVGPASRLGSSEPRDKTGLRLSPHLEARTYPFLLNQFMGVVWS